MKCLQCSTPATHFYLAVRNKWYWSARCDEHEITDGYPQIQECPEEDLTLFLINKQLDN